jgi:hypothetical protein
MVGNTCGQSDAQVDQCGGCCCCSCFCVPDQGELPVPSSEDPPLDVKAFFWKRFARLAPLWYLGNLLALPLFFYNVKQIFAPWHFWTGAVLSLPPVGLNMWVMCHPPAGHLWTISTMAFYLIFPAIFHRINRVCSRPRSAPALIRSLASSLGAWSSRVSWEAACPRHLAIGGRAHGQPSACPSSSWVCSRRGRCDSINSVNRHRSENADVCHPPYHGRRLSRRPTGATSKAAAHRAMTRVVACAHCVSS